MRAIPILTTKLFENLPSVHKARKSSLSFAIESLCHGTKLGLTSIGRSTFSKTTAKHNIKRVDRLLGNTKVIQGKRMRCNPNSRPESRLFSGPARGSRQARMKNLYFMSFRYKS
jgi:hypothetical protein